MSLPNSVHLDAAGCTWEYTVEDASQAADDMQAEKLSENIAQGRQAKVEIPFCSCPAWLRLGPQGEDLASWEVPRGFMYD